MSWSSEEFSTIDLGDKRLDSRFLNVCEDLYLQPLSSINQASRGWKETKAAYRLFDNDKVSPERILSPHVESTLGRLPKEKKFLAIQDTTFFNYDEHEAKEGLGLIHSNKVPVRGILAHNTLLSTLEGDPIGLFDQKIYSRDTQENKPKWYEREIEEKESFRWIEVLEKLKADLPNPKQCIVVADREADISEFIKSCFYSEMDFVVRSSTDRIVGKKVCRWSGEKNKHLKEYISKSSVKGEVVIEAYDRREKRKRKAHLNLRFSPVEISMPWRMNWSLKHQELLDLYVVEVKEFHPPKGCTPIEWRLLTSLQVESFGRAIEVIEIYEKRWLIEEYHKVLKSGCRVEDCRLETADRLKNYLSLMSVIAWRLLWMTKVNRTFPKAKCSLVFSKEEWQPLYRLAHRGKKNIPKKEPTINQTIRWLASLGGFLGRKSDGEPGIVTIWRGWQQLNAFLLINTYG